MFSAKLEHVLDRLAHHYQPFNLLSPERLNEVASIVRFMEMRKGEIFQIAGGTDNDYLFVVEGRLEIIHSGSIRTLAGPNDTKKRPVVLPAAPATTTLMAREDAIICHADRGLLDSLISWDEVVNMLDEAGDDTAKLLDKVRNSLVFRRLPLEAVEMAFHRMRTQHVKAGEYVIQQGEEGDAYYVIVSGKAEVYQRGIYDDEPQKIADIGEGDAFGCEALIAGSQRNESVKMIEDGELLVLDEDAFQELISSPLIKTVNPAVARTMAETGHKLIDVRYPEEFDDHHIPGATLIPLFELRNRMDELDKSQPYIVYCHGGARSAVATLILTQNQFDVLSLDGGIRNWPYETQSLDEAVQQGKEKDQRAA